MRTIIDTSSFVALARYYYPFDSAEALNNHLQREMSSGTIILLDRVLAEAKLVSQGLAYNTFACLQAKNVAISTKNIVPPARFYNMLDNNFVDGAMKRLKFQDDEVGYQNERDAYINSADCAMIVYAMNNNTDLDPIQILTEESPNVNDGKLFKKIPSICSFLNIPTLTAVEYLKQVADLKVKIEAQS